MRNFVYLNGDAMVNVHPEKSTVQINNEYYCEMNDSELFAYMEKNDLSCVNGKLLDNEDGHIYGTVLVLSK